MPAARRDFIEEQVSALGPLDFVVFAVAREGGIGFVEAQRAEDGQSFHLEAGEEPHPSTGLAPAFGALGFTPGDERATLEGSDATAVATTIEATLLQAFGVQPGQRLDVHHGSRRAEVEQRRKLEAMRERVGAVLTTLLQPKKFEVDAEGDFTFPFESTRVFVAPRAVPGGPLLVRVLAVTNVEIDATPPLGLFIAETNFGLPFGRFSLDVEHRAVWFEQSIFGEGFADDDLAFLVRVVASTADQFDDRIAATFGGRVFNPPGQPAASQEVPGGKPGTGGYL